jgi:hypothetical protein
MTASTEFQGADVSSGAGNAATARRAAAAGGGADRRAAALRAVRGFRSEQYHWCV